MAKGGKGPLLPSPADAHGGHLWQNVTSFNKISYFTVLTYEAKKIKHEPLKY